MTTTDQPLQPKPPFRTFKPPSTAGFNQFVSNFLIDELDAIGWFDDPESLKKQMGIVLWLLFRHLDVLDGHLDEDFPGQSIESIEDALFQAMRRLRNPPKDDDED